MAMPLELWSGGYLDRNMLPTITDTFTNADQIVLRASDASQLDASQA